MARAHASSLSSVLSLLCSFSLVVCSAGGALAGGGKAMDAALGWAGLRWEDHTAAASQTRDDTDTTRVDSRKRIGAHAATGRRQTLMWILVSVCSSDRLAAAPLPLPFLASAALFAPPRRPVAVCSVVPPFILFG
jgi:hypothetical protein